MNRTESNANLMLVGNLLGLGEWVLPQHDEGDHGQKGLPHPSPDSGRAEAENHRRPWKDTHCGVANLGVMSLLNPVEVIGPGGGMVGCDTTNRGSQVLVSPLLLGVCLWMITRKETGQGLLVWQGIAGRGWFPHRSLKHWLSPQGVISDEWEQGHKRIYLSNS